MFSDCSSRVVARDTVVIIIEVAAFQPSRYTAVAAIARHLAARRRHCRRGDSAENGEEAKGKGKGNPAREPQSEPVMYVQATAVVVCALQLLLLPRWAGAGVMVGDQRRFVESMLENDALWAEQLNVTVKVDTALVTPAAMDVLRRLGAATPGDAQPGDAQPGAGKRGGGGGTVVTVNALRVVVDVVCVRAHESDAVEFATAVAASAFKCRALPLVLAQARAVDGTVQFREAANFRRPSAVWEELARFTDKLSQYRESLRTVAEMHRLWETVVKQTLAPSPSNEHGTLGDVTRFRALAEDALRVTCEQGAEDAAYARLGVGGPSTWDSADATAAVYEAAGRELHDIMTKLPVGTMDRELWKKYLHV